MYRLLLSIFLISSLAACECCPETATGFSANSCCTNSACAGMNNCGGVVY